MPDSTTSPTPKVNGKSQSLLMRLSRELVRLPGIGQKTAQRLAFHLMKTEKEEAIRLAEAIREVKEKISFCPQCRNIAEGPLCDICLDPKLAAAFDRFEEGDFVGIFDIHPDGNAIGDAGNFDA